MVEIHCYERDDIEGLDSTILTSPTVLKYSGHEDTFSDPLVDCRVVKQDFELINLSQVSALKEAHYQNVKLKI